MNEDWRAAEEIKERQRPRAAYCDPDRDPSRTTMLPLLLVLLTITSVLGGPLDQTAAPRAYDNEVLQKGLTAEDSLMGKLNTRCSQRDTSACLMLKLVTYMNRLLKKSSIGFGESLVITQTAAVVEEESPLSRSLQEDSSDETQLGLLLANKLWNFVRSRYFEKFFVSKPISEHPLNSKLQYHSSSPRFLFIFSYHTNSLLLGS